MLYSLYIISCTYSFPAHIQTFDVASFSDFGHFLQILPLLLIQCECINTVKRNTLEIITSASTSLILHTRLISFLSIGVP